MLGEAVEQQRPGDVEQQPGPVPRRPAVVELPAQVERDLDQPPLGDPLARGEKAHAARVGCVVELRGDTLVGVHLRREPASIETKPPRGQRARSGYVVMRRFAGAMAGGSPLRHDAISELLEPRPAAPPAPIARLQASSVSRLDVDDRVRPEGVVLLGELFQPFYDVGDAHARVMLARPPHEPGE